MKTKEKKNLWARKRKTFMFGIVIVMIIVLAVSFVSFFQVEEAEKEEEYKPYDSMYNASRYFFRVFYPDDWDVSAGSYGFMMNEETGLVLELFPLKKIIATAAPTSGSATGDITSSVSPTPTPTPVPTATVGISASSSASIDPRAGMERNKDLTVSFYYYEYDEILAEPTSTPYVYIPGLPTAEPTELPTALPTVTPAYPSASGNSEKNVPVELSVLAMHIFNEFKKEHEEDGYTYSVLKTFQGDTVEFYSVAYNYMQDDIRMSGEVYVASRAMAYYIIHVEGTASAFTRYDDVVENILYNIKFSVFEY